MFTAPVMYIHRYVEGREGERISGIFYGMMVAAGALGTTGGGAARIVRATIVIVTNFGVFMGGVVAFALLREFLHTRPMARSLAVMSSSFGSVSASMMFVWTKSS